MYKRQQSDSLGAVARVLDGSVDLALVGNTFDEPDCCFIPFCKDKLVIATPVNQHYLQYQQKMDSGTLDFSDFLREPFIMRETGSGTKKEIDRYLEKRNIPASSLHLSLIHILLPDIAPSRVPMVHPGIATLITP